MRYIHSVSAILFLGIFMFSISCRNDKGKTTPKEKTTVDFSTTRQKLLGKWINKDDSLSTIIYTQAYRIDSYANATVSSDLYKLSKSCNDDEHTEDALKRIYIIEGTNCWSINTLNKKNLEFTSMSRGTTHSYTRIE